ncbi:MAG: APC family permease [Actinomycetota bacterium]|nr:APC family permease [Actinomycetota bacterium]
MSTDIKPLEPPPEDSAVELPPETLVFRIKRWLLGPPLRTEQLPEERLGKPTALAVFASDNLSSAAYASEEILHVLVPAVGVAAFAMSVPISAGMLVVLAFLVLSYRQTIKAYPTAGGAYMVTRDNFGIKPAQLAGVALLIDYVLTVAVSIAAAAAAITSAISGLRSFAIPLAVVFILLVAYGNLRGVKQSGRIFSVPTYFFLVNMVVLLAWGAARAFFGELPVEQLGKPGQVHAGHEGTGLFMGASLFVVARAFASGGAAVTGVEAISNGVSAFRPPEWKNARTTLVMMASFLAVMFMGISLLNWKLHVAPYEEGSPTVISEVGRLVFGEGGLGRGLYYSLQVATMAILVMAANTSFADFPRLANFHATDHFMPHQLVKRGHRLVFSNGIIFLAISAIFMVVVTGAEVNRLIPLYAIGVFTSFTCSQAGMTKHHWREREEGWRRGLLINGPGAVISGAVAITIAVTKFTHGAWVVIIAVPVLVVFLIRLARRYEREEEELEEDVPALLGAATPARHVVIVLIDRLDLATARAVRYARGLEADELRAVHFVLDEHQAEELNEQWQRFGPEDVPLEVVECPERRITHCALVLVAHALADEGTQASVVVPDRVYSGAWARLLHDETGRDLAREMTRLPHANVITVPYHVNADESEDGEERDGGSGEGQGEEGGPERSDEGDERP